MAFMKEDLFEILRGFSSLVPPSNLSFPAHLSSSSVHAFFLNHILLSSHFRRYPPSAQYRKVFWKWAIQNLEQMDTDENFEIDARIYEHYLSLLPPSGLAIGSTGPATRGLMCPQGLPFQLPPPQSYVTHFWKTPSQHSSSPTGIVDPEQYNTVTLLESRTTIESGTTGMRTWLASFVLSQYLINHPDLIDSRRILELGSGIGFMGIIVASLQHKSSSLTSSALWMTDVNEDVLTRCQNNVQMSCNTSSLNPNIRYKLLDWSSALDPKMSSSLNRLLQDEISADLILGADIIFDPTLIPSLVALLKLCLQPGRNSSPKTALIAATVRNQTTIAEFLNCVEKHLKIDELEGELDRTTFLETIEGMDACENVKIFKLTLQ